jgi:hypothetical protein
MKNKMTCDEFSTFFCVKKKEKSNFFYVIRFKLIEKCLITKDFSLSILYIIS